MCSVSERTCRRMALSFSIEDATVSQIGDYLLERGISDDVVDNFHRNQICGQAFLNLTDEDVKELVPPIGIRIKIREILRQHQKVSSEDVKFDFMMESFQTDDTANSLLPMATLSPTNEVRTFICM